MEKIVDTLKADALDVAEQVKAFVALQKTAQTDYIREMQDIAQGFSFENALDKQKSMLDATVKAFTKGINDVVSFNMKLTATVLDKSKAHLDFSEHTTQKKTK